MLQPDLIKNIFVKFQRSVYFIPTMLVIGGIMLLILFSDHSNQKTAETEEYNPYDYAERLEEKLKKHLSDLSFVEECSVMITLSSLENNEFLENSSVNSSKGETAEQYSEQNEYLIVNKDGNDTAIIETKKTPKICGVLIIYKGENDVETQMHILEAASTVLGVQSNKVCVINK